MDNISRRCIPRFFWHDKLYFQAIKLSIKSEENLICISAFFNKEHVLKEHILLQALVPGIGSWTVLLNEANIVEELRRCSLVVQWKATDSSKLCKETDEPSVTSISFCYVASFGGVRSPPLHRYNTFPLRPNSDMRGACVPFRLSTQQLFTTPLF